MSEMNRREFVAAASMAAAACLAAFACPASVMADEAAKTIDVGTKADYTKDGITSTWIKSDNVVVVRNAGKIYAFTAVCTHKGATIGVTGDHLTCPKHHSIFNIDGTVKEGKATSALVHYAIAADAKGHLIVDKSKSFTQDKFDDAASFVKVD